MSGLVACINATLFTLDALASAHPPSPAHARVHTHKHGRPAAAAAVLPHCHVALPRLPLLLLLLLVVQHTLPVHAHVRTAASAQFMRRMSALILASRLPAWPPSTKCRRFLSMPPRGLCVRVSVGVGVVARGGGGYGNVGASHGVTVFTAVWPRPKQQARLARPASRRAQHTQHTQRANAPVELEGPQEVGGLLEGGAHSQNLVDEVLHAQDVLVAQRLRAVLVECCVEQGWANGGDTHAQRMSKGTPRAATAAHKHTPHPAPHDIWGGRAAHVHRWCVYDRARLLAVARITGAAAVAHGGRCAGRHGQTIQCSPAHAATAPMAHMR
jgi:hypothetical protein